MSRLPNSEPLTARTPFHAHVQTCYGCGTDYVTVDRHGRMCGLCRARGAVDVDEIRKQWMREKTNQ